MGRPLKTGNNVGHILYLVYVVDEGRVILRNSRLALGLSSDKLEDSRKSTKSMHGYLLKRTGVEMERVHSCDHAESMLMPLEKSLLLGFRLV